MSAKKKFMLPLAAAALMLSSSITVSAAPEVIQVNGKNEVFDHEYYANTYPDLAAALGSDRETLIQHYISCGKGEGRAAYAPGTDVDALLAAYQETAPTTGTAPVQAEKKLPVRKDYQPKDQATIYPHPIARIYDLKGRVLREVEMSDEGVVYESRYEYDAQGLLIKETYIDDYNYDITSYSYDGMGNVIREEVMDGWNGNIHTTITYGRDAQGRLLSKEQQ